MKAGYLGPKSEQVGANSGAKKGAMCQFYLCTWIKREAEHCSPSIKQAQIHLSQNWSKLPKKRFISVMDGVLANF